MSAVILLANTNAGPTQHVFLGKASAGEDPELDQHTHIHFEICLCYRVGLPPSAPITLNLSRSDMLPWHSPDREVLMPNPQVDGTFPFTIACHRHCGSACTQSALPF